jgi:hypothetical protein
MEPKITNIRQGYAEALRGKKVFTPVRGKGAYLDKWQQHPKPLGSVPRGENVGLLLEHAGLVDIDLDIPEAGPMWRKFCSTDTLAIGRGSEITHYLYTGEAPNVGYKNVGQFEGDDDNVLEVRYKGKQVMWAGSTHPDTGEPITVIQDVPPIPLPDAKSIRMAATAALIAHILNHTAQTGRHDLSLPLAGYLLRHLDKEDVDDIVQAAWEHVGGDVDAALRNVKDTAENKKHNTGGPTLDKLVPGLSDRIRGFWGWKTYEGNLADRLTNMGLEDATELLRDQFEQPHALVGGVPIPLDSKAYPWLTRLLWDREKKTANREALGSAVGTLAALALVKPERELHIRAAHHEGAIYYQLAPGRVVKIEVTGWGIDANPPVLFREIRNLKDLPDLRRGGNFDKLLGLMNLKSDKDRRLVVAWLALSLHPDIPRPVLLAMGTQGSAKSTMQRILKRAVDPTEPEDIAADRGDIFQKANNTHVLMIDNAGVIKEDLANTLCKIVTGGADSKRKLYTNAEDVVMKVKRAVLINGINVPTDRPDLLDRCVPVELKRVPKSRRRPESAIWAEFGALHPELLGAVFDALAAALRLRAPLQETPRMADWSELAAAVYEHMGWGRERFQNDWSVVEEQQNAATFTESPLAQAVI